MWVRLGKGDVTRKGDYFLSAQKAYGGRPYICVDASGGGHTITRKGEFYLRELKGWEAVEFALRQEVLGNDKEGCETTNIGWDCECAEDHMRSSELESCPRCGTHRDEQPDSRKAEVILKLIGEGRGHG